MRYSGMNVGWSHASDRNLRPSDNNRLGSGLAGGLKIFGRDQLERARGISGSIVVRVLGPLVSLTGVLVSQPCCGLRARKHSRGHPGDEIQVPCV